MPPKPNKLQPALVGGAIIGLISAVPFLNLINCICCAGVILGGFLAVMFYKNNITPGMAPLSSNDALAVGALAGLFGAVIGTILDGFILVAFGNVFGEWLYDFIVQVLESAETEVPEELYDQLRQSLVEQAFGVSWLFMSLIVGGIVDTLFGLLGGLIGYSVFKPKGPPTATPVSAAAPSA